MTKKNYPERACRECGEIFKPKGGRQYACGMECAFTNRANNIVGSCVEWTGTLDGSGYGALRWCGRRMRAHRFAWERAHGAIPKGMMVLHACDNRKCVNIEHLSLGSYTENSNDKIARGRQMRGERAPGARFTEAQVRVIKARIRGGDKSRAIAADYGVDERTIGAIRQNKNWKWVA